MIEAAVAPSAVVISRHLNASPPALADTRPELASLDPVLDATLTKDPADRFASCMDFARAFAKAARQHDLAAATTMSAPTVRRPPASTPGRLKSGNARLTRPGPASYPKDTPREDKLDRLVERISIFLIIAFVIAVCVFIWVAT